MERALIAVNLRNPRYNRHGTIDVEMELSGRWVVFTATPDDVEDHGRLIYEHLADPNAGWEIAPYVPTPEELERKASQELNRSLSEVDRLATNPILWADLSADDQQALSNYRKALVALPEHSGWPNIEWPERPAPLAQN